MSRRTYNFQEKSDAEKEEIEEEEKRFEGSGYDRDLIEALGKCPGCSNLKLGMSMWCLSSSAVTSFSLSQKS